MAYNFRSHEKSDSILVTKMGFGIRQTWVPIPALPLNDCVILDKFTPLSLRILMCKVYMVKTPISDIYCED